MLSNDSMPLIIGSVIIAVMMGFLAFLAARGGESSNCHQEEAEMMNEMIYSQGRERSEEDSCPICTLPIPPPTDHHSVFNVCCMKRICNGCAVASKKRGMSDCAFCRSAYTPQNDADEVAMIQARVEKNDPVATSLLGEKYYFGKLGLQKDMRRAVGLWTEAAELGSIQALYELGVAHYEGRGVLEDNAKAVEFYKKAAMQGHVEGRYNLGCCEAEKGNYNRAVRHFLITAKMGHMNAVETIKRMFMFGIATKEQYTEALRGYQDAMEEMKSHDRDEAKRQAVNG